MISEFHLLDGGYCTHKESMVLKTGRCCETKFPAMFACIHHEKFGYILYDTGYSKRFFEETTHFPYSVYAKLTPVHLSDEDCASAKLKKLSIQPEQINYIIISHFHADHIAAIKDFPNARFIYMQSAYDKLKSKSPFKALLHGFLPGLLPDNFEQRRADVPFSAMTFAENDFKAFDIFDDGSLTAVELPGHARGQIGLFFSFNDKKIFLIADSCWMSESFEKNTHPSPLTYLIADNRRQYQQTLAKLQAFYLKNPHVIIIPSHCGRKFLDYVEDSLIGPEQMNGL